MLCTKLGILGLFLVELRFALTKHIHVDLANVFGASNSLSKVLRGSFFLELLNLVPDGIRYVVVCSNGVKGPWETVLREEVDHLVIFLPYLREFALDKGLQQAPEFFLHAIDCRRNQVPEFFIELWSFVQFISHTHKIDEVLWI